MRPQQLKRRRQEIAMLAVPALCGSQMLCPRVGLAGRRGVYEVELLNEPTVTQNAKRTRPMKLVWVARADDNINAHNIEARLSVAVCRHPCAAEQIKDSHAPNLSRSSIMSTLVRRYIRSVAHYEAGGSGSGIQWVGTIGVPSHSCSGTESK